MPQAERRHPRPLAVAVGLWDAAWKTLAIRRAIKNRQYRWIIPLLVTSTAGILPIVYLWRFARPRAAGLTPAEEYGAITGS